MLVTSYEYAHQLVENNKFLSWDGWDIVEFKPNDSAMFTPDGAYRNGSWGFMKVFKLNNDGWKVPKHYVR